MVPVKVVAQQVRRQREQLLTPHLPQNEALSPSSSLSSSCCSLYHQHRTFASSSCEAMKLSWLTLTRSEAVTTVTMRFSSRPTRFPTSSSSRSLASYWLRGATSEWCRGRGEGGWRPFSFITNEHLLIDKVSCAYRKSMTGM